MFSLILLQSVFQQLIPASWNQPLERYPAALSLIYLVGIALILFIILVSVIFTKSQKAAFIPNDLPVEVRKKLGTTATNFGLWVLRVVFVILAFTVFGFHVYWTLYAAEEDEQFQRMSAKDLRYRRVSASTLRPWILDRSGSLNNALAYYKKEKDGDIVREYPLEQEMAHLLGTERGAPGLERTLFQQTKEPTPESWEVLFKDLKPKDEGRDVKITIDRELERYAMEQLKGSRGSIVILNPQTGDLLAMISSPSFSLSEARNQDKWIQLESNRREKPLSNRAMREFYVPGSTFKLLTMIGAYQSGLEGSFFDCRPGGFHVPGYASGIDDFGGGNHNTTFDLSNALKVSCNQYFAQMGISLGADRMARMAKSVGIEAYDEATDAVKCKMFPDLINASTSRIQNALAPCQATIFVNKDKFNQAQTGFGQGGAGQMTPLQIALIASSIANKGRLMKLKIEADQPPQMFNQVVRPDQAEAMLQNMRLITAPGGTAANAFAKVNAAGILTGGKTGTASKEIIKYDKNNQPIRTKKTRTKKDGTIEEYFETEREPSEDYWFVCVAPLENPTLAIAVVVEGKDKKIEGRAGGQVSAPIAANLVLKARDLGLLGNIPKTSKEPQIKPNRRNNLTNQPID